MEKKRAAINLKVELNYFSPSEKKLKYRERGKYKIICGCRPERGTCFSLIFLTCMRIVLAVI
jgi:hypothetical protein